jgi:hypothetical protein
MEEYGIGERWCVCVCSSGLRKKLLHAGKQGVSEDKSLEQVVDAESGFRERQARGARPARGKSGVHGASTRGGMKGRKVGHPLAAWLLIGYMLCKDTCTGTLRSRPQLRRRDLIEVPSKSISANPEPAMAGPC